MDSSVVIDLTGADAVEKSSDHGSLEDVVSELAVSKGQGRRKRSAPSETATCASHNAVQFLSQPRKVMSFTVAGTPRPLKRHKHGRGHAFNPSAADQAKFIQAVSTPWPSTPLKGPIKVEITFAFSVPKRFAYLVTDDGTTPVWRVGRPGMRACPLPFALLIAVLYRCRQSGQVCAGFSKW